MDIQNRELLEGRERPLESCISLEIKGGKIMPVIWAIDPWICAYCRMESKTPQAMHKHLEKKHKLDMRIHKHLMHQHLMVKSKDKKIDGRTAVCSVQPYEIQHPESNMIHQGSDDTREPMHRTNTNTEEERVGNTDEESVGSTMDTMVNITNKPKKRTRVCPPLPSSKNRSNTKEQPPKRHKS